MQTPFIGPSYNLESRPASVQRTINLIPVPLEPGNERAPWVLKDVPGLVQAFPQPAPDPDVDEFYASVRILLRGQGSGTTFTDDSTFEWPQSAFTNAEISTDQSLPGFGPTSIKLTAGYVNYGTLVFGGVNAILAQPFTSEAWVYKTSTGTGIMSNRGPFPNGWAIQTDSLRAEIDGVWSDAQLVPSVTVPLNQWTHLAVTSDGSGLYTYWIDGAQVATNSYTTGSLGLGLGGTGFVIGASTSGGESAFTGFMYARVTVGVCRYTVTFTPPTNFPDLGP